MCAGKSKRFGTHKPKCLAEVQGVPNLERTISKLNLIGIDGIDITVPHDKDYYFHDLEVNLIKGDNKYETQRFSNAFPLTERTVYLYGDVVYELGDLLTILEPKELTTWYGRIGVSKRYNKNPGELMAVQVIDTQRFEEAVLETINQFKTKQRKMCIGWDVLEVHEEISRYSATNFVPLSEYSDDYDDKEELKQINKLINNG